MKQIESFPKLVLKLDKQEENGEVLYFFSCMARYTNFDFSLHAGAKEDLESAIDELAVIAPQVLEDMQELDYTPKRIIMLISSDLPDLQSIYQRLAFPLGLEEYRLSDSDTVRLLTRLN